MKKRKRSDSELRLAAMATDELLDVDVETRRGKRTKFLNKHTIETMHNFVFFFLFFLNEK